jgi:hypothetical protein
MKKRELGRVGVALAAAAGLCGVGLVWKTPPSEAHTCVDVAIYVPMTTHTNSGCTVGHGQPSDHLLCTASTVQNPPTVLLGVTVCVSMTLPTVG